MAPILGQAALMVLPFAAQGAASFARSYTATWMPGWIANGTAGTIANLGQRYLGAPGRYLGQGIGFVAGPIAAQTPGSIGMTNMTAALAGGMTQVAIGAAGNYAVTRLIRNPAPQQNQEEQEEEFRAFQAFRAQQRAASS